VRAVQVLRVKSRLHADHGVAPSQHQQLYFQLYFHQELFHASNPPDLFEFFFVIKRSDRELELEAS